MVGWLVGWLVTFVNCGKTAGRIEMPFGTKTYVDPWNIVLDRGLDPPTGRGMWVGVGSAHFKMPITGHPYCT